ncbi:MULTISPECIES: (E)-4-hydroxy-3-methylbut-2-enyl-diphosphate synthase [Jonquetella]|uniref:4-hydroxy-3-methylbut-2-en-1-yl diphosphate synthase (flavodoxin) n=1 Tax=Jonquetella anthropi DSM 22815 TaxID=885272 RepID=H0UK76_9BACT|nr:MULTISPECIES: (E)-4-hydroxy-3-methylbut-2-enyl-diphosphate synthase [Jonquetella]EHM13085.1 1-hydroxy-2-methyl-2-(E)-butenyl 4-diphosphate synthase [Jonquetella anthropi DSM 22815]
MSRRTVTIEGLTIGGSSPVRVESMLSKPLSDLSGCLEQLKSLASHGCELVRVAFPNRQSLPLLEQLNQLSPLPLMADIHFAPVLAESAVQAGLPAVRINPGNMGSPAHLARFVCMAKERGTVIRIGANGGSLNAKQLADAGGDRAAALAAAVGEQVEMLLSCGFEDLIISAKSSNLQEAVRANALLFNRYGEWPFHVGITEAGWGIDGTVKSACGIGAILLSGIGDTIRVSLSQAPEDEADVAWSILRGLGLRQRGGRLVSCPTCGRKQLDTAGIVPQLEEFVKSLPDGFTLAVMGCEVNGPREASCADLGVAGSAAGMIVFRGGQVVARCRVENLIETLKSLVPDRHSH